MNSRAALRCKAPTGDGVFLSYVLQILFGIAGGETFEKSQFSVVVEPGGGFVLDK